MDTWEHKYQLGGCWNNQMGGRSRTVAVGTGRWRHMGALSALSSFSLRTYCVEEVRVKDV